MRFRRLSAPGASALSLWELEGSTADFERYFDHSPAADSLRLVSVGKPIFDRGLLWGRGAEIADAVRAELHLHGGHGVADALRSWLRQCGATETCASSEDDAESGFLHARTARSAAAWSSLRGGTWEAELARLNEADAADRQQRLDSLIRASGWAEVLEAPPRLVLAGPPNAGKSSLLNRWLRRPRVTVSEYAGTTRDPVAALVPVGGQAADFLLQLVDTAGLWTDAEGIDRAAVEVSLNEIRAAWKVLWVFDAAQAPETALVRTWRTLVREQDLRLLNRCDLGEAWSPEELLGGDWLRGAAEDDLPTQLEQKMLAELGPPPAWDALLPMGNRRRRELAALRPRSG